MFEAHKAKKAAEAYQAELGHWQAQRDAFAGALDLVEHFPGTSTDGLMLGAGEAVFFTVTNASLVEDRAGKGHYQGGSAGVSIPLGHIGSSPVRYRVGATRGHYVQAPPTPTAIDVGTVYVTNTRVIFEGAKQTRECLFAKLIGFQHDDAEGSTTFSVSNRQKPTNIHYGPAISGEFDFRLDLALAHFRGTVPQLVAQLQAELAAADAHRPTPPA